MTRTAGTARAGHRPPHCAGHADGARIVATGRSSMQGYTLIEVIVAFAVLALALSILLGILSNGTRQVRWADDAGRAALHAQSLLDQAGVGEALAPGHREGDFEDGRYRWALDVTPWRDPTLRDAAPQPVDPGAPQLLQLVLDVRWGDGGPRNRLQLQTLRLVLPDTTQATPL
jgi:general secretion pathway protein I